MTSGGYLQRWLLHPGRPWGTLRRDWRAGRKRTACPTAAEAWAHVEFLLDSAESLSGLLARLQGFEDELGATLADPAVRQPERLDPDWLADFSARRRLWALGRFEDASARRRLWALGRLEDVAARRRLRGPGGLEGAAGSEGDSHLAEHAVLRRLAGDRREPFPERLLLLSLAVTALLERRGTGVVESIRLSFYDAGSGGGGLRFIGANADASFGRAAWQSGWDLARPRCPSRIAAPPEAPVWLPGAFGGRNGICLRGRSRPAGCVDELCPGIRGPHGDRRLANRGRCQPARSRPANARARSSSTAWAGHPACSSRGREGSSSRPAPSRSIWTGTPSRPSSPRPRSHCTSTASRFSS